MFVRLRHRAVVCRDHENSRIDSAGPGKHVADEALVSRNIDDVHSVDQPAW